MRRSRLCSSLALAAIVAVPAFLTAASSARADSGTTVTVMTRNLYFGADLSPVIAATSPTQFLNAVAGAYNQGVASDWSGRALQWAKEIAAAKPDLVGLQEAVVWRTEVPGSFSNALDANNVVADFTDLLTTDLKSLGVPYNAVSSDDGYDVEGPGAFTPLMDVRLTQHDVILARVETRLKVGNPLSGQYAAQHVISTVGGPIPLPWAWASVDASVGGHTFRFATTHLDSNFGDTQVAQAQEFLAGAGSTALPLVWAGDFNSDADTTALTGVPPDTATYQDLVAAGLADAWEAVRPGDPGYTCCETANLDNPTPTLDQRIDLVLTRGPWRPLSATLVGANAGDKTPGGLWPSDHAGVVVKLSLQGQS
jgi:endonuclease/exonuclease/phosphatase family metal-dependent hydrolase